MKRRAVLKAAGLTAAVAVVGCKDVRKAADPRPTPDPKAPAAPPKLADAASHLLNRATFGPTAVERQRLAQIGAEAWVDEQLNAPLDTVGPAAYLESDETLGLKWRLNSIETLRARSGYALRDMPQAEVLRELQKAVLLRAAYSKWQLRERMVDFWTNHFNIYGRKVSEARERDNPFRKLDVELMYLMCIDQGQVIRQNALGKFGDMLAASMQSPAMLGYLDNQVNRKGVPNENYAREVMELHTLGVGGGYSQKDVKEVARCLTGWTIEEGFLQKVGSIAFDASRHDDGEKTVLGHTIPAGGGREDAAKVRQILLQHPSTGKFLGKKLVRYFYGDGPHAETLRGKVAEAYTRTDGDIKAMLRALLLAPEFSDAAPIIKRPLDFVVSSLRATGAVCDGDKAIQAHLERMGQPLFQWPMPDGFPERTAAWTGSLLSRWNFAVALAGGQVGGVQLDAREALAHLGPLAAHAGADAAETVALALCAPSFQWR